MITEHLKQDEGPERALIPGPSGLVSFTGRIIGSWRAAWPITLLLIIEIVVFAVTQDGFLTKTNLQNALTSVADLWVIAMGMTIVVISGGFDLSAGAVAATSGYLMARLLGSHVPGGLAFAITAIAGAGFGAFTNGLLIGRFRLNVFVVTLATMTALTGVLDLWSGTVSIYVTAPISTTLSTGTFLGLQAPIWIMVATFLVAIYIQRRTYFGRDVFAVGGSYAAARLSGIRTERTVIAVYGLLGACAAIAGVIDITQSGAATPSVDDTLPLQAIAAVLLGGTALTGGVGGVGGTTIGVLFIGLLQNGLGLAGVASSWQQIVTGVILIAAVLGARVRAPLARRRKVDSDTLVQGSTDALAPPDSGPAPTGGGTGVAAPMS